jgi:hypothetical protein
MVLPINHYPSPQFFFVSALCERDLGRCECQRIRQVDGRRPEATAALQGRSFGWKEAGNGLVNCIHTRRPTPQRPLLPLTIASHYHDTPLRFCFQDLCSVWSSSFHLPCKVWQKQRQKLEETCVHTIQRRQGDTHSLQGLATVLAPVVLQWRECESATFPMSVAERRPCRLSAAQIGGRDEWQADPEEEEEEDAVEIAWSCSACTYNNAVGLVECEMCGTSSRGGKNSRSEEERNEMKRQFSGTRPGLHQ